jgi:glycosyltransferase involved in cell wall biosynthesis
MHIASSSSSTGATPRPDASAPARGQAVAAIITTRHRPRLVQRAVRSVLAQTHPCAEIIVVIDGCETETETNLRQLHLPQLRVISTGDPVGGSEARNIGARLATADWIAFLDDDDEWHPEKIQRQLSLALHSLSAAPIVSCRARAVTAAGVAFLWPRREKGHAEHLADYLLARNSMAQGEGLVSTSMLLAPRHLLLAVPFTPGLKRHQDWDWLLRAEALAGAQLLCAFEPLLTWYIEEPRPSVSGQNNWTDSWSWIHRVQPFISPRAYASFLLVFVSAIAAREARYDALWPILRAALRFGKPRPLDLVLCGAMWTIPQSLRRWIRNSLWRERQPA